MQLRQALAGLSLLVLSAAGAWADLMPCQTPPYLVQNCSFEDTSAWQEFGAWDSYDAISSPGAAHSGDYSLKLGSDPTSDVPGVSQYIDDEAGVDYTLTFWWYDPGDNSGSTIDVPGDSLQYFAVEFGGQFVLQLYNQPASAPNTWEMFTYTVIGGGETTQQPLGDSLVIEGYSDHQFNYVDDVTLTETSDDSSIPEPGTLGLFLSGLVGVAALKYRHKPLD
jgi:hypothetical protein